MRSILNISLPAETVREIKEEVKSGGYASTSELVREALRARKRQKLLDDIEQSRREIKQGKGRILKSLKDLD